MSSINNRMTAEIRLRNNGYLSEKKKPAQGKIPKFVNL